MGKPLKVKLPKGNSAVQDVTKIANNVYPNTDLYGFIREDGNVEVVTHNRSSQVATKSIGLIEGDRMFDIMVKDALGHKKDDFEVTDEVRNAFWNYQYYCRLTELNEKGSPLNDKEKNWAKTYQENRAVKECAVLNRSKAGANSNSNAKQSSYQR